MLSWLFRAKRRPDESPRSAEALFEEGTALAQRGRLPEAIAALTRAAELKPQLAEAHFNLGSAYRDIGEPAKALAAFRRVTELVPGFADAHYSIGVLLREQGALDEAAGSLRQALALAPANAEAHFELGHVLTAVGEWREAVAEFRRAVELRPDFASARWAGAMAEIPAIEDAAQDLTERRAAFAAALGALEQWFAEARPTEGFRAVAVHQPFFLAYQEMANRDLLARYGALCARLMAEWQKAGGLAAPARRAPGGRIRVAIVSAHVSNHSVWNALTRGWLDRLDRRRFEVALFHLGGADDEQTDFARQRADSYEEGHRSFDAWAQAIHANRPDVLLYPEIGMDATTAKLASLRLARVQAASWGHPETTGLPTVDYYVSAADLEPQDAQENYTETLEMLPGLGCWLEPPPHADAPAPPEPDADAGRPLLVCPGMPFKYAARHDALLVEIARRVPTAGFVFFRNKPEHLSRGLEQRLRRRFAAAGLDFARRVRFIPWQSLAGFRRVLSQADLCLDSVGFSGFNTALQAVECDLPIVTREGRFLRGRLASGILRRMSLEELIAPCDEAYVELAAALCAEPVRRERLRRAIRERRGRVYLDAAPIEALQDFLERVA